MGSFYYDLFSYIFLLHHCLITKQQSVDGAEQLSMKDLLLNVPTQLPSEWRSLEPILSALKGERFNHSATTVCLTWCIKTRFCYVIFKFLPSSYYFTFSEWETNTHKLGTKLLKSKSFKLQKISNESVGDRHSYFWSMLYMYMYIIYV